MAGGAAAGNAIAKGGSTSGSIVHVPLGNGSTLNVEAPDASSLRIGDLVEADQSGNINRTP